MMRNISNPEEDEIDLRELFSALWSHKFLIITFVSLAIFFSGYYALTSEKKFRARAIFQIEEIKSNSGFNFSGELGALASLAGLATSGVSSSSELLLERASGREFIIAMKEKYSLDRDIYFNSYDPNFNDPQWKAIIKRIIGWQKTDREKNSIVESNVIENYREKVAFEFTDGGAIEISVVHIDPQKASEYANKFMEEMRRLVVNESDEAQKLRLNYLSKTLADALQDMEEAQENLKNYALENSAMAQENFISDSLKLDEIRMEKRKVTEISELLAIIERVLKSENLEMNRYETLRSNHPLVDDIEFRRILGMSETISAWTWPDIETIDAVSATLRDRIKRLDVEIKNIEENAQIYATSAEDLAKFTRDAKIAEATYTVLIEQVKSQSLAAGFQAETFKVFEYATPPLSPIAPNNILIVALGAVLGTLIGCAVAMINVVWRDVCYTKRALLADVSAKLTLKSKSIRRLSQKSISDIILFISKKQIIELDEAALKIANKKIVYVLNSGGRPSASDAARLLATQSARSGRNVVLCDSTGKSNKDSKDASISQSSGIPTVSMGDNINALIVEDGASFFTSTSFESTIKDLMDRFDQVFICSSKINAHLGLMALENFNPSLMMIAGVRKTKKSDIKNIKTKQNVDILFYE